MAWIDNYLQKKTVYVINYPCPSITSTIVLKGTSETQKYTSIWYHTCIKSGKSYHEMFSQEPFAIIGASTLTQRVIVTNFSKIIYFSAQLAWMVELASNCPDCFYADHIPHVQTKTWPCSCKRRNIANFTLEIHYSSRPLYQVQYHE